MLTDPHAVLSAALKAREIEISPDVLRDVIRAAGLRLIGQDDEKATAKAFEAGIRNAAG